MTHRRSEIRAQIVTVLSAHPDLTEFFVSRGRPVSERKAPYLAVVINSESASRKSDYPSESRVLDVRILLVVKAAAGTDDVLDGLAETVESLMAVDPRFSALAERSDYQGTAFDFESGAAGDLASCELRYNVEYIFEPVTEFDDFSSAVIGFDMASPRNEPQTPVGADGQIDATVTIEDLEI